MSDAKRWAALYFLFAFLFFRNFLHGCLETERHRQLVEACGKRGEVSP